MECTDEILSSILLNLKINWNGERIKNENEDKETKWGKAGHELAKLCGKHKF